MKKFTNQIPFDAAVKDDSAYSAHVKKQEEKDAKRREKACERFVRRYMRFLAKKFSVSLRDRELKSIGVKLLTTKLGRAYTSVGAIEGVTRDYRTASYLEGAFEYVLNEYKRAGYSVLTQLDFEGKPDYIMIAHKV